MPVEVRYRRRRWWEIDGPLVASYLRLRPPAPLTDCLRPAWWLERLVWRVRALFRPRRKVEFRTVTGVFPMRVEKELVKIKHGVVPVTSFVETIPKTAEALLSYEKDALRITTILEENSVKELGQFEGVSMGCKIDYTNCALCEKDKKKP